MIVYIFNSTRISQTRTLCLLKIFQISQIDWLLKSERGINVILLIALNFHVSVKSTGGGKKANDRLPLSWLAAKMTRLLFRNILIGSFEL